MLLLGSIVRLEVREPPAQRREHALAVGDDAIARGRLRDQLGRQLALEDIELVAEDSLVDLRVLDLDEGDERRAVADLRREVGANLVRFIARAVRLGVAQSLAGQRRGRARVEGDRGHDHGADRGATPRLVDTERDFDRRWATRALLGHGREGTRAV